MLMFMKSDRSEQVSTFPWNQETGKEASGNKTMVTSASAPTLLSSCQEYQHIEGKIVSC